MFKKSVKPEYATPQVKIVRFRIERGFEASDPEPPDDVSTTENYTEVDGGIFGGNVFDNNVFGN